MRRARLGRIQGLLVVWPRLGGPFRAAAFEKLALVEPVLAEHRTVVERLAEHLARVAAQLGTRPRVAQGGGGSHAAQRAVVHLQAALETPDQAGQVGALGAVEGVQLVDHEKAQRAAHVVAPDPLVARPEQEVVQHLVVGQQDVRRRLLHGGAVGDHRPGPHLGLADPRAAQVLADVEARRHLPRSLPLPWMSRAMRPAWSVARAFMG